MQKKSNDGNAAQETPFKRTGPSPLPVHLMGGVSAAGDAALGESLIEGINKYRSSSFFRPAMTLPAVWRSGEVTLSYCAAKECDGREKVSLLLVPSMINRSTILDILEEKSFVRWLASRDVYLLDWGVPANDDGQQSVASVIDERLRPCIAYIAEKTGGPVHCAGYCMGGVLLAQAALHDPRGMASLCFLAAPWDFHAGDRRLAGQIALGTPAALQMMAAENKLPARWVQSVFALVNSDRVAQKFSAFSRMDSDSFSAHLFVAVEDWLNDGLDLPVEMAQECLVRWYGQNDLVRRYKDQMITVPSFVIAPQGDRLVPKESALALCAHMTSCKTLIPQCGHVGMMTSRSSEDDVWRFVAEWVFYCA